MYQTRVLRCHLHISGRLVDIQTDSTSVTFLLRPKTNISSYSQRRADRLRLADEPREQYRTNP